MQEKVAGASASQKEHKVEARGRLDDGWVEPVLVLCVPAVQNPLSHELRSTATSTNYSHYLPRFSFSRQNQGANPCDRAAGQSELHLSHDELDFVSVVSARDEKLGPVQCDVLFP
eukprot:3434332-Rhodomonas_salina.2